MKHLLLFTLVILFTASGFSKQKAKKRNPSYSEYMDQYGDDKTSVTLINLFFDKRDNAGIGKMSFLPLSASVTVIVPPIGAGLLLVSSPLFVSGLITRNNYSHKKLKRTLQEYKSNYMLSKKLRRKVNKIHRIEEEIEYIELQEARLASLRGIYNQNKNDNNYEKGSEDHVLSHVSK